MDETELQKIEGTVETVIFKSDDECFGVIEIDYDGELLTVAGDVAQMNEGEIGLFHGYFVNNKKYGRQFKSEVCEKRLPDTQSGILKFLSAGVIKGIGPALAKKIVNKFGIDTFEILKNSPEELSSISGISPKKAKEIGEGFSRVFGIEKLMVFLSKYQIKSIVAIKIWKEYGEDSFDIIDSNPYLLCINDFGISFTQSDSIAEDYGFESDCQERLIAALVYIAKFNTRKGFTCIPEDKLVQKTAQFTKASEISVYDALEQSLENGVLTSEYVGDRKFIFIPMYYAAEKYIANRVGLMTYGEKDRLDEATFENDIFEIEERLDLKFADRQKQAIKGALENNIFILTGGPGTGKTTTINAVIELMEKQGKKVLLCAPTGRAAQRMEELTDHEAKTIHRLLEFEGELRDEIVFHHNERNPLKADMLIVDEMSMVDVLIMESLLKALKLKTKLLLVGDNDQIPSVGSGAVLKDLIEYGGVETVHLNEIFRQARKSLIVTNAHKIVNGEMPILTEKTKDFFFMQRQTPDGILSLTRDLFVKRLPVAYKIDPVNDIQIICPTRVGEAGTESINRLIQQEINPKAIGKNETSINGVVFRTGDKVMQTKNNYEIEWEENETKGKGIYNGDIGTIISMDNVVKEAVISFGDKLATYSYEALINLEHAYAITVHKSQGNEFDYVILPLMNFKKSPIYYRNILYTAVTRAKKLLVIVGSAETVRRMVDDNKKSLRYTGLQSFLENSSEL